VETATEWGSVILRVAKVSRDTAVTVFAGDVTYLSYLD